MILFCLATALLTAMPAWSGGFGSGSRGTSSAEFLGIGVGARAAAMGEAYTAVADEATAMYWNPAAMTRIPSRSVTFMHSSYINSSFLDYGAFAQNLGPRGALGASFQYFSAGGITQTDGAGNDVGRFTPYDLAISLGYARKLDDAWFPRLGDLSVGLTGKFVQSKILHTAQTGAIDVGILSPGYHEDRLRLAATLSNFGGTLGYQQVSEDLPLVLRLGGSYRLFDPLLLSLETGLPRTDDPFAAAGAEYWLHATGPWKFAGRAGFNSATIGDIDGFTGVSFGVGLRYKGFVIDYALVPFGGVGPAHRIALTHNFSD